MIDFIGRAAQVRLTVLATCRPMPVIDGERGWVVQGSDFELSAQGKIEF